MGSYIIWAFVYRNNVHSEWIKRAEKLTSVCYADVMDSGKENSLNPEVRNAVTV